MRTFPSSANVQGKTYYYYPGCWIQLQDRTLGCTIGTPKGAFLAELPIMVKYALHTGNCIKGMEENMA